MVTKKEAKWLSDLETLKKHHSKFQRNGEGYLIKDTKENAEGYMRVTQENSDRYVDEYNEKIKREKLIDKVKQKVNEWSYNYKENQVEIEAEIKEFAQETKGLYNLTNLRKLVNDEIKKRKDKVKDIEQEDKKKYVEEKKKEFEESNFSFSAFNQFTNYLDIAKDFHKIQPFHYDPHRIWWLWNLKENKWERVDDVDLMNAIDNNTQNPSTNATIKSEIVEALKRIGRKNKPRESKKTWIQFKDLIIDITTGERINATAKYFVTNPIPYELNKDNFECTPVMDKIFEEWVGKDYVRTLYEIISYCLLADYPMNRLFCFIGSGMNGKSKFLELVTKFLGKENCSATELDVLISSRFEITRLHKKLVCQMGETNFNEMKKTSILKKLTGGDLIGFEYKNKDLIQEKNYAKILISTNSLPTTDDKTIGFYRRWLIVDFPNQFSEKKDILADIPEEEYSSLALKCCGILKDLLDKREFHKEGSIEDRKNKFEAKSDFVQHFLKEYTYQDVNGYITKADFYKKFIGWSKENRHRELAENSLGRKMKVKGIDSGRKYADWLYEGKGGQMQVWEGIKWKD